MRVPQIRNSGPEKSRESAHPSSGFVSSRHQSGIRGGWRALHGSEQADAWDTDDEDVTSVLRLPRLRQTILPTAPALMPVRPLWQVGLVLESDELARMWVQQGHMNDETAFVWSNYRQAWVPVKSVPELQAAIAQAHREQSQVSSRASLAVPATSGFATELPRFQDESGYWARAREWPERFRGYFARHLDWRGHARILVSRRASWQQRRQAISAIAKYRSAQWLVLSLVAVLVLGTLLRRSVISDDRTSVTRRPASGSMLTLAAANPVGGDRRGTAEARADLEPIAIDSLPLVTDSSPRSRAKYAPKATLWTTHKTARVAESSVSNNTLASSTARVPFNVTEARSALDYASSRIRHCTSGDASGSVIVTFQPSGTVQDVSLNSMAGEVSQTSCILGMFRGARVTPFSGGPVAVKKSFRVGR